MRQRLSAVPAALTGSPSVCPGKGCATQGGAPSFCDQCTVKHLAVCSALEGSEINAMEEAAGQLELAAGQTLAREGDRRHYVFTVTRGALRLVRLMADGRRQVVGFAMPGDYVGFSDAPTYRNQIEAVTQTVVCRFEVQRMRALCDQFPALEHKLFERACAELDSAHESMLALARMNPVEKLADFIVKLFNQSVRLGNTTTTVLLPMSRGDIADHLGLTVETVSRSFTKLRRQNLIALPDVNRVQILDLPGLEALVGG